VLFTVGTTGESKAAVLTRRGILSTLQGLLLISHRLSAAGQARPSPSTAVVSLPLFHIDGPQQLITPLVTGGTVFTSGKFDPMQVVELIDRHSINLWSGVTTMVSRVVDHLEATEGPPMPQVRTIGMDGSPVSDALRAKVSILFPNTKRRIAVTYGLSETGGVVATATGDSVLDRPGSVGRALSTVNIRINRRPGADEGEILVRAPSLMLGYLTAGGAVEPGPLTPERWLRTGDVGASTKTGSCSSTDRLKDIIIRGGKNIAATHVENILYGHPAIAEIAVFGAEAIADGALTV
jgi:long-chain acyl-CoA synthetase